MLHLNEEFDVLDDEGKISYISQYPEKILLFDRNIVKQLEQKKFSADGVLFRKLKVAAIRNCGELILVFEENGFSVDGLLIRYAFISEPSICKYCKKEWFTPANIRTVLKADVNNFVYIPKEWFYTENGIAKKLIKSFQRILRRAILGDPTRYRHLPLEIIYGNYSAFTCANAYTDEDREFNALKINEEIWETNGGKLMFKIARKNLDIALKMLNETERETLAVAMLHKDVNIYKKFPESLRENPRVKIKLYTILKDNNLSHLIDDFYKPEVQPIYEKKYIANEKRRETIKRNKEKHKKELEGFLKKEQEEMQKEY